jgi:hypothetical protein
MKIAEAETVFVAPDNFHSLPDPALQAPSLMSAQNKRKTLEDSAGNV